jgi:hypothetical protein
MEVFLMTTLIMERITSLGCTMKCQAHLGLRVSRQILNLLVKDPIAAETLSATNLKEATVLTDLALETKEDLMLV